MLGARRGRQHAKLAGRPVARQDAIVVDQFVEVDRHLRLELGYQMQYLDPLGVIDIYNHTLLFGVAVRTPQALDLF